MKITSIFKKTAVFATAMLLVLVMVVSMMPMASADEATEPTYKITKTTDDHGETLAAMNVSQSGSITMMFYFTGLTGFSNTDYIEITVPTTEAGVDRTYKEYYNEANIVDGRYLVKVPVAAAQQTDLVGLQWYKDGKAGTKREYSVKYYADKVLDLAAEDKAGYVDMANNVISMLNYGAMAQKLFKDYNGTNLANKGLFADGTNPIDYMISTDLYDAEAGVFNSTESIKFVGAEAYLQDIVSLRIYVDCPAEGTTATVNGQTVTINTDENGNYIGIRNISANNYDKMYNVVITNGNEEATASYSVLSYCLNVLENYKNPETVTAKMKDTARALYLYYAWAKNYDTVKDANVDDYKPGVADCTHGRSYVYGGKAYCSDCGATAAMRLGLTANEVTLNAGESKDVTFTLRVAGTVDLQALIVTLTPNSDKATLAFKSIDVIGDGTGNLQGDAALNIVLDAANPITEACDLATVTYTVTASEGGTYKITPVVQEATNAAKEDVVANIFGAHTVLDVNCATHTLSYDILGDNHLAYCDKCQTIISSEAHTVGAWTHVLEAAGGKVTGELFETGTCVCGYTMTREVYYKNGIDSIRVNNTVINPRGADIITKNQTAGVAGAPDSRYNTFVVSPENFIDANKNLITFHDTDSLKTGGWFGVNGGVARYVIKINDGEWQNYTSGASDNVAADSGIGKAIVGNANITDKEGAFKNANYQNFLTFADFEAYANQTITVTLGAVPAANPGTEENPNVLITAVIENLKIECTHLGQNAASAEATDVPTIFNATCVCGETYTTSDINDEGLKMFNADEILTRTTGHSTAYTTSKMTENGLDFVRFELLADKTTGSEYLWYFADNDSATAPKLTYGVSDTFMIIYRANEKYPNSLMLFANQTEYKSTSRSISDDGEWHIAMFDLSALYDDKLGYIKAMRFDIFDDVNIAAGATFDIAYMGFFKDANHAMDNYKTAIDKYGFDKANFRVSMDAFKVDGTGYSANTNPKPDNMNVISVGGEEWKAIEIDFAGTTIKTTNSSLNFCGWIVTPSGAKSISYRIIDANGNASELREYLVPSVITAANGIAKATTGYMYGDGRLNGSAFQATTKTFDLSGYAGETVTVEVILINNWGQTATVMKLYNVAVATCANHVLVDVPAKASTCAEHGNEAYKTCESCGKIYDMSEEEINAIPTLPLDENAHNKVNKTYTAPTTTEAGWEAHIGCAICNKAWDAMGNEIEVPTIAKIVPTTKKYFGYEALSKQIVGGPLGSLWANTAPSADRTYVRYARAGQSSDGYINFMASNQAVTGQYVIIKYRTDSTTSGEFWANTTRNDHQGMVNGELKPGVANFAMTFDHDGEWHVAVFNLAEMIPSYVLPNDNGEYVIQWARIDILNNSRTEGYFDVAYIAYSDDVADFASIMQDGDEAICPHKAADNAVWTLDPNDPMYEKTDCVICVGKAERYVSTTSAGLHIFTPDVMVNKTGASVKPTLMFSENGMPYINVTAAKASGEENTHLFQDTANPIPGSKLGKYVGILYRTDHNEQIQIVLEGKLNVVKASVKNFSNVNTGDAWKFEIVNVSTAFSGTTDKGEAYGYDGSQLTAFRIDYFNNARTIGDTVDVAFLAFFNSSAEAYAYYAQYVKAYEINCEHFTTSTAYDSNTQLITTTCDACGTVIVTKACDHSKITTAWDSATKLYHFTCDYCGNVETSDMIYKSEAYSGVTAGSASNFLTATTVTENGETFVRYTAVKDPVNAQGRRDPYFFPWQGNTSHVTGQFMIIKYRVTNNGKDMNTSAYFAASATSTKDYPNGQNGDSSNRLVTNNTLYADGEWHYIIMTPNIGTNKDFGANADGTYTWKWARMNLNAFAAYDGSCYFDIDEVAFADNIEAATYYIYKNDTTSKSLRYVVNLDDGNVTIDNASFMGASKRGNNAPIVLDMSQKTLTTPTSLKIGGWVCVDGGVKAYKMRVTSVDGKAVENPELVTFVVTPGNRNDIYTANKAYYTEDCAIGAGMGKTAVNLTAWAGHTVTFEIVAITNYGAELVVVRCTNVVVPVAE